MAGTRKTFLDGFLYFLNILFALLLLGSYLAYYVPPSLSSIFSLLALGYPVWFFINLMFAIYWLIRFKLKIFLPIIAISIGYAHVGRLYQFGRPHKVVSSGHKLKVMSYNVRLLNAYGWIEDTDVKAKTLQLIADENPDILLLQEFTGDKDFIKQSGYPHHFFKPSQKGKYGSIILSRIPFTKKGVLTMEGDSSANNQFQYADVQWKGRPLRIFNVHLASVGLEQADYELLENPDTENQQALERGLKSIVNNLSRAFVRREVQIEAVMKEVKASPHPVLLAGDFNDVPQSYTYRQIYHELQDSFESGGQGFGKTYVKSPVPLRIDYIFHSKSIHAFNFKRIKKELSDHYPIITDIEWKL